MDNLVTIEPGKTLITIIIVMKRILIYSRIVLIIILVTTAFSCERLSELHRLGGAKGTKVVKGTDEKDKSQDPCGEPVVIRLAARDNSTFSPASVTLTNDHEYLNVIFEVTEGSWRMDMMYLQVGPLGEVPLADGYPAFWDFAHQYADVPVASYTFRIPLADLDECFVILAQAHVVDGNNDFVLWSEGINPDWTSGPYYTEYCVEICSGHTTDKDDDKDDDEEDEEDEDDD
jgi:hypothetical protein